MTLGFWKQPFFWEFLLKLTFLFSEFDILNYTLQIFKHYYDYILSTRQLHFVSCFVIVDSKMPHKTISYHLSYAYWIVFSILLAL